MADPSALSPTSVPLGNIKFVAAALTQPDIVPVPQTLGGRTINSPPATLKFALK